MDEAERLRQAEGPDRYDQCWCVAYKKNSESMYRELESRQEQALDRAEQLLAEYDTGHNPQMDNPCTTVHLLVQQLRKSAGP